MRVGGESGEPGEGFTIEESSCIVPKKIILHIKAMAWAGPSQSQALVDGFGLAWHSRKPKLGL